MKLIWNPYLSRWHHSPRSIWVLSDRQDNKNNWPSCTK